ncbi:MAG: sugar ABC transporter permease [Actinobacteria bacterium]|nr:sugar ABC transporter permease [Cyanobacteriota bacterium]MCL5771493.1 sugar ABC transporter permease [Actinomycetota bacterium]
MRIKRRNIIEIVLYLLPAMLVIGFVFFFPIVRVIQYSFNRVNPRNLTFIGLTNYQILFTDDVFLSGLKNNIILLVAVPIIIFLSVFFAILLYEKMGGWKFYRFVLFLPYILAIPVVGVVFSYIFQLNGLLNFFLEKLGLKFLMADWLGSSKWALWTVMFVIIWKELGFGIVLIFARLMSVPKDLYEAAEIDGANWIQKHIHVTVPQTRNVVSFLTVITIITMLSWVFNYIYVMTLGGPGSSTMVSEYYIYQTAFRYHNMGQASAASVVLFLITFIFVIIQTRIRGREEVE